MTAIVEPTRLHVVVLAGSSCLGLVFGVTGVLTWDTWMLATGWLATVAHAAVLYRMIPHHPDSGSKEQDEDR